MSMKNYYFESSFTDQKRFPVQYQDFNILMIVTDIKYLIKLYN